MNALLNGNERAKLGAFLIILFILQGFVFYTLNINTLGKINRRYINQNISIVGEISNYNETLGEKIIPLITGKKQGDYNKGKEIMDRYSYNTNLNYDFNPLFEDINNQWIISLILLITLSTIIILVGVFFITNPMFKQIKILTIRAENIVENKFYSNEKTYNYKGSLNKFIVKFQLMEDRIKNSISLLKDEKINLKNIINDISHQLKTPLMALAMYNDILKDHKEMDKEEIDDFINLSKEQLERMNWLVKTLLKYARLESNAVEYRKEIFSLKNTVEESINPLKIKAEEKNQVLTFICKKDIEYYHDRKWVGEAISNIVKNAIEHTKENGKIEVNLYETPLSITVSIKDNGEGIEKSELKKIFKRFYKGENSVNPTSIGIGLCLSKSIIQSHNGDINVESELGKGSTFYITFLKTVI
ncbi:sensor histidine kinase [Clostridium tarantellae]|uniref:histidine kinase n=1 Tax=Clostridium tarantellae TaxID=39493 RepID=A0A6I1MRJ1_9CLOT|nr:HAMP domain-containing sensor histidine kinase [Clostridium tarantellae]MPQ44802.1 sensor histidine kinase [Clostridium tarantellae]